jgi:hypothetical protein
VFRSSSLLLYIKIFTHIFVAGWQRRQGGGQGVPSHSLGWWLGLDLQPWSFGFCSRGLWKTVTRARQSPGKLQTRCSSIASFWMRFYLQRAAKNSELLALVKASNGYAFDPDTISQALELCELETLLSLSERPVISELAWKKPESEQALKGMLAWLSLSARPEDVAFRVAPPRREPSELSARSMNVEKAIEMHNSKDAAASRGLGGEASESAATDLVSGESMNCDWQPIT